MFDSEMGCFPFLYGDDVAPNMPPEQRSHIAQSHKLRLRQRYDSIMASQQNIKDAVSFLLQEGVSNTQLVEYKLKKLNRPALMMQLRDALYEQKVASLKNYEDLDLHRLTTMDDQIAGI